MVNNQVSVLKQKNTKFTPVNQDCRLKLSHQVYNKKKFYSNFFPAILSRLSSEDNEGGYWSEGKNNDAQAKMSETKEK